jgi:hypothetical protein
VFLLRGSSRVPREQNRIIVFLVFQNSSFGVFVISVIIADIVHPPVVPGRIGSIIKAITIALGLLNSNALFHEGIEADVLLLPKTSAANSYRILIAP